tara:strand:+ start:268 stop:441 length:174 start_codon:yes stop_codon:yes gene_type:complete
MEVNDQELEWMYWHLMSQRALRDSPTNVPIWAKWKQTFLDKVNYERTKLDSSLEEES